jgi:hypothetical protein
VKAIRATDVDNAIHYLAAKDGDEVEVSDGLKDFIDRMIRYQSLVLRHSKVRAVQIYAAVFGISRSQAYRDYQKMELIFGSSKKANKDFIREVSILKLEKMEQIALENDDLKTAANIRMKLFDWSTKEDIQPPFDPTEMEPTTVIIGDFPEKFKNSGMPKSPEERQKRFNELRMKHKMDDLAEDIDFDEHSD